MQLFLLENRRKVASFLEGAGTFEVQEIHPTPIAL
jgi:hypothetical protein